MKKLVSFEAKVKYVKVFPHNRDMGDDTSKIGKQIAKAGGYYTIVAYPSDPDATVKELESKGVNMNPMNYPLIKEDEEGKFLRIRRKHNAPIGNKGEELTEFGGPPVVKDEDGNTWDPEVNIGNYSVCDIVAEVWGEGNLKLKGVRVIDHVPYEEETVPEDLQWVL
jgi:hypothetical protein